MRVHFLENSSRGSGLPQGQGGPWEAPGLGVRVGGGDRPDGRIIIFPGLATGPNGGSRAEIQEEQLGYRVRKQSPALHSSPGLESTHRLELEQPLSPVGRVQSAFAYNEEIVESKLKDSNTLNLLFS